MGEADLSFLSLVLLNSAISFVGFLMCVCRAGKWDGSNTKPVIKTIYILYMLMLVVMGVGYLLAPSIVIPIVNTILVLVLAAGIPAWWHDAPEWTQKVELEQETSG